MRAYIVPFLVYILTIPIVNFFLDNTYISYTARVLFTGLLIFIYRKEYKLRFKLDFLSVFIGILIFAIWLMLEGHYPLFSSTTEFFPSNSLLLLIKLTGLLLIAPFIEEVFTRGFLIRFLIDRDWQKVPIGKFTWLSFIITVLFFGFSHNRWLSGLITCILLNLLLYRKKSVESCILAHFTANLLLAIYVLTTSSWFMW